MRRGLSRRRETGVIQRQDMGEERGRGEEETDLLEHFLISVLEWASHLLVAGQPLCPLIMILFAEYSCQMREIERQVILLLKKEDAYILPPKNVSGTFPRANTISNPLYITSNNFYIKTSPQSILSGF